MVKITQRPCYVCDAVANPVVATEPMEHRVGRPVLPEDTYTFVRCRNCSTLYVDSNVSDAWLRELYAEETIDCVDDLLGEGGHERIIQLRMPEFGLCWKEMKRYRSVRVGDQLLDVGCQTGEFAQLAQRDGVVPNGVELSPEYAAIAQRAWNGSGLVHSGGLETAPFREGQFAYVCAFETLEHICDPVAALKLMRPWLAADGILAVSVPSSDYFHFKYWLLKRSPLSRAAGFLVKRASSFCTRQVLPHTHIYNFSHRSLRMLLERAGFEPLTVRLIGWHGKLRAVMGPASQALERLSRSRIGLSPSLLAIARPASAY